jgi:hypothetical protein
LPSSKFSNLNPWGDSATTVDVGNKVPLCRIAIVRSCHLPPKVMLAICVIDGTGIVNVNGNNGGRRTEIIGPKGQIFQTANIGEIV